MKAVFVELPPFERFRADYFSSEEYRAFQNELIANPEKGDVIQGTGGLRKIRVADSKRGKGKRGGSRVIYYWAVSRAVFLLFTVYGKNVKDDLSPSEKRYFPPCFITSRKITMSERNLFEELKEGLEAAEQYLQGKITLRAIEAEIPENGAAAISPEEIRAIRESLNFSQAVFAHKLRCSVRTYQGWEQGKTRPNPQAALLLRMVQKSPKTFKTIAAL